MKRKSLAFGVIVTVLGSTGATAATTMRVAGTCTQAAGCSAVSMFDPSLGTLTALQFTSSILPYTPYTLTNMLSSAASPTFNQVGSLRIDIGGQQFAGTIVSVQTGRFLDAGQSVTFVARPTGSTTKSFFGADLAGFIGNGDLSPVLSGDASITGAPSYYKFERISSSPTYYAGSYSLTYTYDAAVATAVPESAAWAMMLLGFGMVGATVRRRRRSAALWCARPEVTTSSK